jgi:hypothetical protein
MQRASAEQQDEHARAETRENASGEVSVDEDDDHTGTPQ